MLVSQSVRAGSAGWLQGGSRHPAVSAAQMDQVQRRSIMQDYLSTPSPEGLYGYPTPDLTGMGGVGIVYPGWSFSPR